jgi:hypothetical protein
MAWHFFFTLVPLSWGEMSDILRGTKVDAHATTVALQFLWAR